MLQIFPAKMDSPGAEEYTEAQGEYDSQKNEDSLFQDAVDSFPTGMRPPCKGYAGREDGGKTTSKPIQKGASLACPGAPEARSTVCRTGPRLSFWKWTRVPVVYFVFYGEQTRQLQVIRSADDFPG